MNFHTFELSYKLSTDDVRIVYNELYNASGQNYKPKDDCAVFKALQDYGIIIFIKKYKQDEYNHHVLYYRINPRRVLENHNYIGIFNSKNIDKLIKKFNILIKTVSPFLPEFDSCNISRIDYCSNVELNDQAVIDSYINLLKRGYFPSKYTIKKYKNEKSKRNTLSKNGITITGNNGIEVTYYNKYRQLKEKNPKCRYIDNSKKIIRIEIRCFKKKVRHLTKKFKCTSASSFLKESDIIGKYIFKHYANIFYGAGDFYKLTDIYAMIDKSSCKKKSKKLMKELVKSSATHSSLDRAFDILNFNKSQIKAILKKFNKIGVSPVVIPRRYEFDTIRNPLDLALEYSDYDDLCV